MITNFSEERWKDFKNELHRSWNYISEDEWENTRGDLDAVTDLIEHRYGQDKTEVFSKISELYKKYSSWPNAGEPPFWTEGFDADMF